jgi:type I restriction enzyme, R subunit
MKPEERARQKIDQLLVDAGWVIQDQKDRNLGSSLGVAVREFPVSTGYADYLLFVDRKADRLIEAKSEGTTLTSAEFQSDKYPFSLLAYLLLFQNLLPITTKGEPNEVSFL